jgi:tetratricopeptide (TPR) repeat protein
MTLRFKLNGLAQRILLLSSAIILCILLTILSIANFVRGTLADTRVAVRRELLTAALEYLPDSPRMHGRLAKIELAERNRDLQSAISHIEIAIKLSPYDYRYHLTLASIKEAQGDRPGAEEAVTRALHLSPNDADIHWRLANLRVRQNKLEAALQHFHAATSADSSMLPNALDLVWQASAGQPTAVERITSSKARDRLTLARFLLRHKKAAEAVSVFDSLERSEKLGDYESPAFLNDLIAAGEYNPARTLWISMQGSEEATNNRIWNGGFESDIFRDFSQFDWSISRTDYARIGLDGAVARSGVRSLRIDFAGRDTTRLSGEIKQLVLLKPATRYQLECYVRRSDLVTPEGPRIVVADLKSSSDLASSEPLAGGSGDWQRLVLEFTAPTGAGTTIPAYVSLKRIPRFSYDDPTRGTVWLDDFWLTEK